MAVKYDKDKDYMALMDAAEKAGDYKLAAQYEQQRNAKIQDMGLGYETSNKYAGWLDDTDYGEIGKQQMALGASAQDVLDTYNARKNKASGTIGMQQYANDDLQQEMWDYITANYNKPSFNLEDFTVNKPTYSSPYAERIDAALNEILGRQDFSYDAENDPLYQQYRNSYLREGDRAMNDALAAAASGAGGMNSYALAAAQQANNYYGAQVADKIPELQQLAYDMYLNDYNMDVQNLGLLQGLEDTEYSRYRDSMSDYYNDLNFGYTQYRDSMGDWQYEQAQNYEQDWNEREWNYALERDTLEDSRYDSETAYNRVMNLLAAGVMPSNDQLAAAGVSATEAMAYITANQKAASTSRSGGGDADSTPTGVDWTDAENWYAAYGEDAMDDYIGEHYKKLGFPNKSQALAAWNNHLLEMGGSIGDIQVNHPETIDGKSLGEYSDAAGNYQDMASMCETLYRSRGKEAVLEMLREAYSTGVLNLNDYNRLFNKYRSMSSSTSSYGGGGGEANSF